MLQPLQVLPPTAKMTLISLNIEEGKPSNLPLLLNIVVLLLYLPGIPGAVDPVGVFQVRGRGKAGVPPGS